MTYFISLGRIYSDLSLIIMTFQPLRTPGSAGAAAMTDKHKLYNINVIEAFFINLLIYTNQIRPETLTPCNILQTLQQIV